MFTSIHVSDVIVITSSTILHTHIASSPGPPVTFECCTLKGRRSSGPGTRVKDHIVTRTQVVWRVWLARQHGTSKHKV